MTTTTKQIFNYIQGMNPSVSTVSSLGTFVTNINQQVADSCILEITSNLPKDSLAYKIATSLTNRFSEKQRIYVLPLTVECNRM